MSIVSYQDKVKSFLEAIAVGNIRDSLEFFRNFLTAGNTDSCKIIGIMKKSGTYLLPDHEFIKSMSLESRRFFSETESPILNLFFVSDMEFPSLFTKLRILQILLMIQYQSRPFGAGYESIHRLADFLKSVGTSEQDVKTSVVALTRKGLIEDDLRTQKYLDKVQAVRMRSSREYYLGYLCHQFAYLDLMQQDTPVIEEDTYKILDGHVESTKMDERFERYDTFVDCLASQENNELSVVHEITSNDLLTHSFTTHIKNEYDNNISRIQTKLTRRYPKSEK